MAFDFKKEYKEWYLPPAHPTIVTIPPMHYVAVRGAGDPNAENGAYSQAVRILYTVSYTLKMSDKTAHRMDGFYAYVVPPLEGFWWQEGTDGIDYGRKDRFHWIAMIRLPDFVTPADVDWAVAAAAAKKKGDCSAAAFLTVDEGLCVQMMHIGPYDTEPATVSAMDRFLQKTGYQNDCSASRPHHEIYLSDPRRTRPEALKTVIRHPIRPL